MGALRVYVTGFITVPEDKLDVVIAHLPDHVRLTQEEDGCVYFNCEQDAGDPCKITVDECFVSEDAFKAHQDRTGKSVWATVTKDMVRTFDIKQDY